MHNSQLFSPITLPCGMSLKNRIAKPAMSDSLGDGRGNPTPEQAELYRVWAAGGVALTIVGEVQGDPNFPEKPGNLVLGSGSDHDGFHALAKRGSQNGTHIWLQLGHAGALAHPPISNPKGPSALNLPGLTCSAFTREELTALPKRFARTAQLASELGFGGVEVHAAHGFLLSQFLSPLFNKRTDDYGGSLANRMRLMIEVIAAIRDAVPSDFAVAVKLNASDQLEGGFAEHDALGVIEQLEQTNIDLIEISGGTYFPGARAASDSSGAGPYFVEFAQQARKVTSKPLMLTGGFKTFQQASDALDLGIDLVGLARGLVLDPSLPRRWEAGQIDGPAFPRFSHPPEGGITAWYTMRMTQIAQGLPLEPADALEKMINAYDRRDEERLVSWRQQFPLKQELADEACS